MARLIVNPGTEVAWDIPLQPGIISLGSGPENHFAIEHPSVSGLHYRLTVTDHDVVIKDLASTGGTFVDNAAVDEAILLDGQTIRLGEVMMRFDGGRIPLAPPMHGAVATLQSSSASCKYHPLAPAQFICPKCRVSFWPLCVNERQGRHFCRACGVECSPLKPLPVQSAPDQSFWGPARGAFSYPFKGDGLIILICGVVFFVVLEFARTLAGMLGPYGFVPAAIVGIFGMGYAFNYAKSIITSTANGEDTPPDWPDCTDWQEDIVLPFGQIVGLLAFTFGPAAILRWWRPGSETFAHAIIIAATVLGALLAPMGMLALAMFESIAALNPLLLVKSILRLPLLYLAVAVVFEILTAGYFQAGNIVGLLIPIPVLPEIVSISLNLYLTLVGMRILGLLYRAKKDELGWFNG